MTDQNDKKSGKLDMISSLQMKQAQNVDKKVNFYSVYLKIQF
jgi:hypothetical protein